MYFLTFAFFCLMIWFIGWQFKMLKKYVLTYDKWAIHEKEGYLSVNGQQINLGDIVSVRVREMQQPSSTEKLLSKSAYYAYMSEMVLRLQDDTCVTCVFNTKGALYKALTQLAPYVRVEAPIQNYKPHVNWVMLLILMGAIFYIVRCMVR